MAPLTILHNSSGLWVTQYRLQWMSTQIIGLAFLQQSVSRYSFIHQSKLGSTDMLAGFLYPVSLQKRKKRKKKGLLQALLLRGFGWLFLKWFCLPYSILTDNLPKVIILSTFFSFLFFFSDNFSFLKDSFFLHITFLTLELLASFWVVSFCTW